MVSIKKLYIISVIFIVLLTVGIIQKKKGLIQVSLICLLVLTLVFILDRVRQNYTQRRLRELLTNVVQKFNEYKIKHWVDYGSLLGIIREGDVIKHDSDTDICLFPRDPYNPDLEKKLVQIVNDLGPSYNLVYLKRGKDPGTHLFRIHANEDHYIAPIYTDIYLTKLNNGAFEDLSGKLPLNLLGNTQQINWNGVKVTVPEKIHETLVWRYGDNYMTPERFKSNERYYKNLFSK